MSSVFERIAAQAVTVGWAHTAIPGWSQGSLRVQRSAFGGRKGKGEEKG